MDLTMKEAEFYKKAYSMISTAAVRWDSVKANPKERSNAVLLAEERYRLTKMPLPQGLGYPIPFIGENDRTEKEIEKMRKYVPMDELEHYTLFVTTQLKSIMRGLYSAPSSAGAILVAPAGWGKSHVFEFFAIMAAQHSLLYKELWMKDPNQSVANTSNYAEQHFVLVDTPTDLNMSKGLKGVAGDSMKQITQVLKKYPMQYTLILDELKDALAGKREDDDVVEGFTRLKSVLGNREARVLGVYATENKEEMEKSALYDGQWGRRLAHYDMLDYNQNESMGVLRNSFNNLAKENGLPDQVREQNRKELFEAIIAVANQVGPKSEKRKWGFPDRLIKTIKGASMVVKERMEKFKHIKYIQEQIKKNDSLFVWFENIKTNLKKQQGKNVEKATGISNEPNVVEPENNSGMISIRDVGFDAIKHHIESPAEIEANDQSPNNDIDEKITEVEEKIKKVKQNQRILKIEVVSELNKLRSQYGDIFSETGEDVGNIKMQDVQKLNPVDLESLATREAAGVEEEIPIEV